MFAACVAQDRKNVKDYSSRHFKSDRDNKTVVMRTANGKEETFRVQDSAVIETSDSVMTFAQFELSIRRAGNPAL
jgi:hypothetical protein